MPTADRWRPPATPHFRALRGATSVSGDDPGLIAGAVHELLTELIDGNDLIPENIVSAIFSATPDLHALYPAAVARALGWTDVPMLCVSEMDVGGTPAHCIRVLLHLSLWHDRSLMPVYLRGARVLRPDLMRGDRGGA